MGNSFMFLLFLDYALTDSMNNVNIIRQKEFSIVSHRVGVIQTCADSDGEDLIAPDGQWDIMVYKLRGKIQVLLFDRPLLQPATVPVVAGQEQLIISFYAGRSSSAGHGRTMVSSEMGVSTMLISNGPSDMRFLPRVLVGRAAYKNL